MSLLSAALLGILYEDKERQDFIFTIYHWWQAVAIFAVYLGSGLPMKVRKGGNLGVQASLQNRPSFHSLLKALLSKGTDPRTP